MKPSDIPEKEMWGGSARHTFGAPEGMEENVRPLEVLVDIDETLGPEINVRIELEEGDLEKLQTNGCFYIGLLGVVLPPIRVFHLPPVSLDEGIQNGQEN